MGVEGIGREGVVPREELEVVQGNQEVLVLLLDADAAAVGGGREGSFTSVGTTVGI